MHVVIARQVTEQDLLEEAQGIHTAESRVAANKLSDLLIGAKILLLGRPLGQLAKVLHRLDAVLAIHAARQIGACPRSERDKPKRGRRKTTPPREHHGEMFAFGEFGISCRLELENVVPFQADQRQPVRAGSSTFQMKG